jgi:CheY-like chemotaxis protein
MEWPKQARTCRSYLLSDLLLSRVHRKLEAEHGTGARLPVVGGVFAREMVPSSLGACQVCDMVADASPRGPILIIEDDDDVRDILMHVLAAETGCDVVCARDGHEALQELKAGLRPGLILLDIEMPRMDGRRFRFEQLQDPALAKIPVVILSARYDLSERASELQAEGFFEKPIDLDDLIRLGKRYGDTPSQREGSGDALE